MSVLVVGASGAVGGLVVAGLLERGEQVRATSRDPRRLTLPPQVPTHAADLDDPASFGPALEGVERVFLYADLHDPDALRWQSPASTAPPSPTCSRWPRTASRSRPRSPRSGTRSLAVGGLSQDHGRGRLFAREAEFDGSNPYPHVAEYALADWAGPRSRAAPRAFDDLCRRQPMC